MNFKYYVFFSLLFYLHIQINQCNSETITYISTERPAVIWYDRKSIRNFTAISKRVSRRDRKHYLDLYAEILINMTNAITVDFYFYQFLTNRYKPSFVEMHFKFCDMMNSDSFLGQPLRNALGGRTCPYPPGTYHLKNITLLYVPTGFPFTKGRIYCNSTLTEGGVTRGLTSGSIDMELKVVQIKKN